MAENSGKDVFEDLDLTKDEISKFKKAFDDPEFRKLFKEYAEEINDPENKKRYEEEIAQMEHDKGMDIKFINPSPGHVIKTFENGSNKIFINICHNDLIGKPSCSKDSKKGKSGICWSLPHSFTPPREDIDQKKKICKVFDVVFHPDTYYMSTKNEKFKDMVESIALDGIEKSFNVKLDKKNFKRLKMKFKGTPVASVIRTKRADYNEKQEHDKDVNDGPLNNFPYPYNAKKDSLEQAQECVNSSTVKENSSREKSKDSFSNLEKSTKESPYTEPKYNIKYSHNFDIQDFRESVDSVQDTRPNKIIVEIYLPLIRSAASCDLDITERQLKLQSEKPAAYLLTLKLDYPVDESNGSARFDKTTKQLIVTLPIIRSASENQIKVSANGDWHNSNEPIVCDDSKESRRQNDRQEIPPLIEVLDSKIVETRETLDDDDDEDEDDDHVDLEKESHSVDKSLHDHAKKDNSSISLEFCTDFQELSTSATKLPEVNFLQDSSYLIVLLLVKHIESSSVKVFSQPESKNDDLGCIAITFSSRGSGGWPMHFLIIMKCREDECQFLNSNLVINSNVQAENATISFKLASKTPKLSVLWYGSPGNDLKEHSFNSGDEISTLLANMTQSDINSIDNVTTDLICHVTEMNQHRVSIQLLTEDDIPESDVSNNLNIPCNNADLEPKMCDDHESLDEKSPKVIVVENKKSKRPQKSILKLSHSESSEEGSIQGADVCPQISPMDFPCNDDDDEVLGSSHGSGSFPLRKSVSFSQRQQQAVFTPGDPVSTLHQTLRNRRKKAKRQKRGGLQRRFSESEKDIVTFRSDSSSSNNSSQYASNSFGKDTENDSRREKEDLSLAQNNAEWGPRRRNFSEGDLEHLKGYQDPSWSKDTSQKNHGESKILEINDCDKNSTEEQSSKSVSESGFVNWSDLPTVKDNFTKNSHRTNCPVKLSDSMTFQLDDD